MRKIFLLAAMAATTMIGASAAIAGEPDKGTCINQYFRNSVTIDASDTKVDVPVFLGFSGSFGNYSMDYLQHEAVQNDPTWNFTFEWHLDQAHVRAILRPNRRGASDAHPDYDPGFTGRV
jgi:hypothetical protein